MPRPASLNRPRKALCCSTRSPKCRLALQAKLLRVLQEREVERVGGKKPLALDIRVVATSNRDIADAVAKGLVSRGPVLSAQCLSAADPGLRQRGRGHHPAGAPFPGRPRRRAGRPGLRLAAAAEAALQRHAWPGNVRELENVIQRAVILAAGRRRRGRCPAARGRSARRDRPAGQPAGGSPIEPASGQSRPAGRERPMTCGRSSANTSWTPWPPPAAHERWPASASGCPRERCVTSCDNIAWKGFSKADFVGIQCACFVWAVFGEAYGKHRYRSDVEHAASDFGRRRRACRRGAERPRGQHRLRPGICRLRLHGSVRCRSRRAPWRQILPPATRTENLHEVMIELQKANISFQEMVQVRNQARLGLQRRNEHAGLKQKNCPQGLNSRPGAPIIADMVVIPATRKRSGRGFDSRHLHQWGGALVSTG
jgi:hypothetical protein